MKLDHIIEEHIEEAAKFIAKNGVPSNYRKNIYWVKVKEKEYPFKYLVRIAHQLTPGNEQAWLEFTSKKIYRDYLENLGFQIVPHSNMIPFFTENDILELYTIGGKTYTQSKAQHIIIDKLKNNAWEKTKYWFNQVINDMEDFTGSCKKVWSQRNWDNGKRVSSFKSYTWARIYREGDFGKNIYFTIGVDGETQSLVYKLDFQYVGTSNLTYEQREVCKKLIKTSPAAWKEVSLANLKNYDWDKLIEESVNFINEYIKLYDKVVEEVWELNQKRIARLAYNTNGWIMPSGPYGKSKHIDSHEARHGYGHEEWIFDISKLINGYHYGFLEPIRKQQEAYADKSYNIWFYTIDGESKKRYWVGEISNVRVLKKNEAEKIKQFYIKQGWFKEMEEQIKGSGANYRGFSNWKGVDLFNICFLPSDINLNDSPYFELPQNHPINNLSRYSFTHFKEEFIIEKKTQDSFVFSPSSIEIANTNNSSIKTSFHFREPKAIEITYLHKTISERLTEKLRLLYGFENVTPEHPAGYGSNRIDIVVNNNQELIFYEIKTYPTLKASIREAIGQLMEYSLWLSKNKAEELIVITQKHNNFEEAKIYFKHLRESFNIPLYYQYFDFETNFLSEKV